MMPLHRSSSKESFIRVIIASLKFVDYLNSIEDESTLGTFLTNVKCCTRCLFVDQYVAGVNSQQIIHLNPFIGNFIWVGFNDTNCH